LQADRNSPRSLPTPEQQALLQRERRAIERAQAGELMALEPILAGHAEALFMFLLGRVGERAQAEDLLKDTFVTALNRIGSFAWQERSIYHWLRQIALNKALDYHRAQGRRRRLCQALKAELQEAEEALAAAPAAEAQLSAEQERKLAQERIEKVLATLHPRYAQAIRLRIGEERPRAECAELLAVSVETFDVLLFRAVRAFRKAYGEPDA
jgi:RNA polymerase sigma-70 factor (ECF subfamily)